MRTRKKDREFQKKIGGPPSLFRKAIAHLLNHTSDRCWGMLYVWYAFPKIYPFRDLWDKGQMCGAECKAETKGCYFGKFWPKQITENPGPGATYCPRCHAEHYFKEVRLEGWASDFTAKGKCRDCGEWTATRKWLNWNDIRDMERAKA